MLQPTSLNLPNQLSPFSWTPKAAAAFSELKRQFTSAPVLIQPYPSRQFVVKVDASDTGVWADLSKRPYSDQRLPCAFYFHRLSPTELCWNSMSSLLWNWLWRNEDTGWKELSSLLLCGWFIRTYLTAKQPKALTAIKPGGHYSLAFSTLLLPTTPIPAQCPLSPICTTWQSFQPGHHSSFVLSGGCNKIEEEEEERGWIYC